MHKKKTVVGRIMASQNVHILLPEAVNVLLYVAKGVGQATCALIKHLELRRLSQITWVGLSQGALEGRQEIEVEKEM